MNVDSLMYFTFFKVRLMSTHEEVFMCIYIYTKIQSLMYTIYAGSFATCSAADNSLSLMY